jgi:hypothetical protein
MKKAILAAVVSTWLGGCITQLAGTPKVQNGPAGCKKVCDEWSMDLVGMVKMGEYSDGCICQVRGAGGRISLREAASAAAEVEAASFHRPTQQTAGYRPGNPMGRD